MKAALAIAAFFALVLSGAQVASLKCFQCGSYSVTGSGSVSPCYAYDESNLKQCSDEDNHCVKYVNEGIVVRQCVSQCKTGVEGLTELYCCQEDGCNGAKAAKPHLMALFSALIFLSYIILH